MSTAAKYLGKALAQQGAMQTKRFYLYGVSFTVFFASLLGCSARRAELTQTPVSTCATPLTATIAPANQSLTNIHAGESITWMIQAQGCTGNYSVSFNNQTVAFTTASPALIPVNYPAAVDKTESAVVQSVNASGTSLGSQTIFSAPFSVGTQAGCSAYANTSQTTVPVDSAGNLSQPVSISFQVSNSSAFRLTQILDNSVAVPTAAVSVSQPAPANPSAPLPTNSATAVSLQLSFSAAGQHSLSFQVQSPSGSTGSCNASVILTPLPAAAPLITSFVAVPETAVVGQAVTLTLQASGSITSVQIDGQEAPLNNGFYKRVVTATTTGLITSNAVVTGSGGTSPRSTTYKVSPTCALQVLTSPTSLPGSFTLNMSIAGNYTAGEFSGPHITPFSILGGSSVSNVVKTIQMAASPAVTTLTLYGPDGTNGTCNATALYQAPNVPQPPTISLKANGQITSAQVPVYTSPSIQWTSSGATNCNLVRNGSQLSSSLNGTVAISNIYSNSTVSLDCWNAGGHTQAQVALVVIGKWFPTYRDRCSKVCQDQALVSQQSPEGARCASGAIRPASAFGYINFATCSGGCSPQTSIDVAGADSRVGRCLRPGQDRDTTYDITLGCFCGR